MMIKNNKKVRSRFIMFCIFMLLFILDLGSVKRVKAEAKKSTKNVNNITAKKSKKSNIVKSKKVLTSVVKPMSKMPALASAEDKEKEKKKLELDLTLMKARWMHQYSDLIAEIERLKLEKEYQRLCKEMAEDTLCNEHEKEIRLLSMQKEKLIAELELIQVKCNKQMVKSSTQVAALEKEAQLSRAETQVLTESKNRLQAEIDSFQTEVQRRKYIKTNPVYLKDPLRKRDKVLVLSDRCIRLNGVITPWLANKVSDQIQYFNNENVTLPIFLIIEESPGGSVASGFHILQSIKYSRAPVYVVLKRYAASMAALITTLATKSYALPNATILHHQPQGSGRANTRESREYFEELQEIWKRLGGKVAQKMGISLNEFEKKLYEKSARGDWEEYADNAKKLKWVDEVIDGIEESGVSVMPNSDDYNAMNWYKEYYHWCYMKGENKEGKKECVEKYKKFLQEGGKSIEYGTLVPYDCDYSYKFFDSSDHEKKLKK